MRGPCVLRPERRVERSARMAVADEDPKLVQVHWAVCRAGGWEVGGRRAWAMRFTPCRERRLFSTHGCGRRGRPQAGVGVEARETRRCARAHMHKRPHAHTRANAGNGQGGAQACGQRAQGYGEGPHGRSVCMCMRANMCAHACVCVSAHQSMHVLFTYQNIDKVGVYRRP